MKLLNLLLITLLCIAVATVEALNSEEIKDRLRVNATECMAEIGAEPADLENMLANIPSMKSNCLQNCLMKQYELMSDDGSLLKEGVISAIKCINDGSDEYAGIGSEITDICGAMKEADPCESAYKFMLCMNNEMKTRGLNLEF